jgi:hypothetical protein
MALTYSYASLRNSIMAWTENSGPDMQAVLDEIIGLAEIQIARESDLDVFRKYARSFFGPGDRFLSKPTDMIIDRHMEVEVGGEKIELARKDTSYLNVFWPDAAATDVPRFYSDWDEENFIIVPTPSDAFPVELAYTCRPDGLSADNPTTWISTNAPDLLLPACMLWAIRFEKGEAQDRDNWQSAYDQALARLNREEMGRQRRTESVTGEPRGTV